MPCVRSKSVMGKAVLEKASPFHHYIKGERGVPPSPQQVTITASPNFRVQLTLHLCSLARICFADYSHPPGGDTPP